MNNKQLSKVLDYIHNIDNRFNIKEMTKTEKTIIIDYLTHKLKGKVDKK
jgi:hypothetical protein